MEKKYLKGCEFLVEEPINTVAVYPEGFTEEHRMLAKTAEDFAEKEILPNAPLMDQHNYEVTKQLLKRAGELGFTAVDIPEKYGGLGLDKISSMLVTEKLEVNGSFGATFGAHTGIGTLPIVYFGNHEQKAKYLPDLASVKKISAYALTEPSAGSDALSIKTRADLSPDGKFYILNGTKQFITNSGFADMWIVFAKVGGDKFTGFIVEKTEGIILGPEEKKMGLKGSSTRAVTFEDVKVPVENLLGEIGKGHKIAFNILNIGRLKLAAAALGGAKRMLKEAVKYTKERKQFNRPVSDFGMIRRKFADMCARIYGLESIVYRIASSIDDLLKGYDKSSSDYEVHVRNAIEEHCVEDSIAKVYGSETVGMVIDEALQCHGGYGYIEEYAPERAYRDARVNRIFEGTNEINRLVITGMLLRKGMKGDIPLMDLYGKCEGILSNMEGYADFSKYGALSSVAHLLDAMKKLTVYAVVGAGMKYMKELEEEQMLLELLSNSLISCYVLDSAVARAVQSPERIKEFIHPIRILAWEGATSVSANMLQISTYTGMKNLKDFSASLLRMVEKAGLNLIEEKKVLSKIVLERDGYPF
jgi:alkylation response protein AidB-like acyl-CoA dehydrogenase